MGKSKLPPEELSFARSIGGYARAARLTAAELSQAGRVASQGLTDRFAREIDPDNLLPSEERDRRARAARTAYMRQLSLRSIRARRRKAAENGKARRKVGPDSTSAGSRQKARARR